MSISRVRAKRAAAHPDHARTSSAQALAQTIDAAPLEVDFASLEEARAAGFEIIDIREPQEVEEIPTPTRNARHIPMAQLLHGNPTFTPSGKTLLVCASGRRSLAATQELRSRGVSAVYSLRGGVSKLNRRVTA
jgi:rhodanese-related sulfurtransferase